MIKRLIISFILSLSILSANLWDIKTVDKKIETVQMTRITTDSLYGTSTYYSGNYEFVTKETRTVTVSIRDIQWLGKINSTKRLVGQVIGLFSGTLAGYYLGDIYARKTMQELNPFYTTIDEMENDERNQYKDYIKKVSFSVACFAVVGYKTGKYFSKYSKKNDLSSMTTEEKYNMIKQIID